MRELLRAAWVIARRDFTATVFSKAFIFFLLGPLFPLVIGGIFGGIGAATRTGERPVIAVLGDRADYDALAAARARLDEAVNAVAIVDIAYEPPGADQARQRETLLRRETRPVTAVLEGGLDRPRLTGGLRPQSGAVRQLNLLIAEARADRAGANVDAARLQVLEIKDSQGALAPKRAITARAGQGLLFILTLLLATMLLSQLIEEKSNKVIEILAAAVPVDAIFLGKLFAMLAISLLGIAVWGGVGAVAVLALAQSAGVTLAPPAVGWPSFVLLSLAYFSMSYLLLGAVFLSIGAQASTAREVQTLSMPVTMIQVLIFALAAVAVGDPNGPLGLFGAAFPLSSPFVMLARSAEQAALWPHLLGLIWQAAWVAMILRLGARLFRRSVLKSGPQLRWRRARAQL